MRLFLQKDAKQDLFVDSSLPLPQHQLHGIRFLYNHFKKKNPGVILNDPPGYGKRVQVVLFLKGIKPLLQKPIFVICPKEGINKWKEHFLEWADYSGNDIAVESSNAFAKYLVFINTIEDVSAFCRRHWSIVIIENNDFHKDAANVTKKVLHFALNSELKIWVTSVDIKAHLDLFPSIYHWLNPGDKTNIHELTQKGDGLKDDIMKSIILEAFLEDIVIRRNCFMTPFTNIEAEENRDENDLEEPRKRSKKCKDITGKKVKRSKKRVIEDNDEVERTGQNNSTSHVLVSRENNSEEYFNFRNEKNYEVTEDNEMDVETFIRDQEPIKLMHSNTNNIPQIESRTSDFINECDHKISIYENNLPLLWDTVEEKTEETEVVEAYNVVDDYSEMTAHSNLDLTVIKAEDAILNRVAENEKVKEENSEEIKVNYLETSDNVDSECKVAVNDEGKFNIKTEETNTSAVSKIDDEVSVKKETENKPAAKKDITEQISDLEKEALNRFKGSILDSLFKF